MSLVKSNNEIKTQTIDHRQSKRDFVCLLNQLCDDDPRTRRWAARDLGEYPLEAVDPLCDRLKIELDLSVREAVLNTLLRIGSEEVVKRLIVFLRSEDASIRCSVVEVLQKLPMIVMNYIEDILTDSDKDVRIFSVNILRDLVHPKASVWLLTVIQNDADVNVVGTAVDCLAEIGKPFIVPELLVLKDRFSEEPYIEFAVDTAIRRIEGNQCQL